MRFPSGLTASLLSIVLTGMCALALTVAPRSAHAQELLLSNLDPNPSPTGGVSISSTVQKAVAFTTGSTDYTLSSVEAYLALSSAGGDGASNLSLALYTPSPENGNLPGTMVADLGIQTVTNSRFKPTVYTFSSEAIYTLEANTRYVLLLDYVNGDDGYWNIGNPAVAPTGRSGSGYSFPVYSLSFDDGNSYTNNSSPSAFSITGIPGTSGAGSAAAPEPSTLSLLGLGMAGGMGCLGRTIRRRRGFASGCAERLRRRGAGADSSCRRPGRVCRDSAGYQG